MTEPNDPMPAVRSILGYPAELEHERTRRADIAPPARRHAEDAAQLLDHLHDWQAEEGMTDTSMLTVVLEAQVEATLALVEQQRIANLIAWQALTGEGNRVTIRRELEP